MSDQSPSRATSTTGPSVPFDGRPAVPSSPSHNLAPQRGYQREPAQGPLNWSKNPVTVQVATPPTSNTAGPTASLVLGLLALCTCWIPLLGIVAWIFAPLGLLFGLLNLSTPGGRTMSIVGASLSGIALLVCFAWLALTMGTAV